jgi:hypothetical protein
MASELLKISIQDSILGAEAHAVHIPTYQYMYLNSLLVGIPLKHLSSFTQRTSI